MAGEEGDVPRAVSMILKMRYYGDPDLRKKAEPVSELTEEIRKFARDLLETMYAENGLGLAATQVGISKRLLAVDAGEERGKGYVLVNPTLKDVKGKVLMEEGCLSFPGIYGKIERAAEATVCGVMASSGETIERPLKGLECRAILHEMDHLEGVLFIDRMPKSHKIVIQGKLKKLLAQTRLELEGVSS